MRLIMWVLTIIFALAGLSVRAGADALAIGPIVLGPNLVDLVSKSLFFLAILACPFLWARSYGFVPRALQVPGKQRLFIALALILAVPLILPWPH